MNRSDLVRAVTFNFPDHIPVIFHINESCWDHYSREELIGLIREHPILFPDGPPEFALAGDPVPYAPWCRSSEPWLDPWGCLWETSMSGIIGSVTRHPLESWDALDAYTPPDFMETTHWYPVTWVEDASPSGGSIGFFDCLRSGEIGHGHTLLKLFDILGYERTIYEMYDNTPQFRRLLAMLEEFNAGLVHQFISVSRVEWLGYAEDLGMQIGPLISPELFRRHILPSYRRLMEPAERADILIHMHADGDIRSLAEDLLTLPVDTYNIQDTVNGIDWIADTLKGRVAIDLDIDRVALSHQNSVTRVYEYFNRVLERLSDPAGGLILTYGLYPGVPIEIADALMDAMEQIARSPAGGVPKWST